MNPEPAILPGLPRSNPTISYWQDPPADISDHRTTVELPEKADFVIIGAGITGASIAYNILDSTPDAHVVLLEAREASSGASGRNGGHTKGASYRAFLQNCQLLGDTEAVKIARLEYKCMVSIHDFVRENQIDCDARRLETVDIIYDQDQLDQGLTAVSKMRDLMGEDDLAAKYHHWDSVEASSKFLTVGALGAVSYEAGSINAYKFVIDILKLGLKRKLNLQCNTPVTSIHYTSVAGADGCWEVLTTRGKIEAKKVILATNGYTAHLYPKLQDVILPLRGIVTAQRPGSGIPKTGLRNSYSFIYKHGYEYMIPRPSGTQFAGDIVIGGGLTKSHEKGKGEYGNTDDTSVNKEIVKYLYGTTETFFGKNWGEDDREGRLRTSWSGIMGYSGDGFPLIGPMPGENGLFIAAAFQGHGMVNCFLCAKALTQMLLGGDQENLQKWFPKAYEMNEGRFATKFSELAQRKNVESHT